LILSLELMLLGIFTLIYIAIVLIIGIRIFTRYFQIKNKILLYAGIGLIGIAFPWSGVVLNFISITIFDIIPPMKLHFFLHGGMSAIFLFFWLMAILNLTGMESGKREKLLICLGIVAIIVEIIYLGIIFYDTEILGALINEIQVDYAPFNQIYLLTELIIIIISGLWLTTKSLKSDDSRIQLKGKLLLSAFILFPIASSLEVLVPLIPIIIIARILIIITIFLIYGGLILPKWMERLFSRKGDI